MAFIDSISDWLQDQTMTAKLLLLFVIVILVSGFYWYFYWSPNNKELKRLERNLASKQKRVAELENIATELPKFEAEFKRLKKEFELASLKLPEEKEIPALIDAVYADVQASGLDPVVFAPKGQVNREIYAEIPIQMSVVGHYFELANFFDRISRLPRIVNVRDFNFKRNKGSTEKNVLLDVDFQTVTFRLLPPPEVESKIDDKKKK